MKRNIGTYVAIALGALFLSVGFALVVEAQQPVTYTVDTGLITVGWDQILRVTVVASSEDSDPALFQHVVQFRRINYSLPLCSFGVCKRSILSQVSSDPLHLLPKESASIDVLAGDSAVRILVSTNRRDVIINTALVDSHTGTVLTLHKESPEVSTFEIP